MWNLVLVAALWSNWSKRNSRTFHGAGNLQGVVDFIFSKVAFLVVKCKLFLGYVLDSILRDAFFLVIYGCGLPRLGASCPYLVLMFSPFFLFLIKSLPFQ